MHFVRAYIHVHTYIHTLFVSVVEYDCTHIHTYICTYVRSFAHFVVELCSFLSEMACIRLGENVGVMDQVVKCSLQVRRTSGHLAVWTSSLQPF